MIPSPTRRWRATALLVAGLVGLGVTAPPAQAADSPRDKVAKLSDKGARGTSDNLSSPMAQKQLALKQRALEQRIEGRRAAQRDVVRMGKGQYVELANEGTDRVFVLLVEFGDEQYPNPVFQGPPADGSTTDVTGPRRNEIPEPDRANDNSTLWQADYDKAHYENMYFNRMKAYFERQSSNRYSIDGEVLNWVRVPFNEALYGRNYCGDIVCSTSKAVVRDGLAVWVQQQLDGGQTLAEIQEYLATFDKQDRYDSDSDGNFDEPDGFIDHMQIVHAGGDEAAGDPNQGSDAIWSHRWYSNLQPGGPGGFTGVNIGTRGGLVSSPAVPNNPTGFWVGDYTIQPENGGLGVFAHEYAHDLGLPDLYDTSGNTGGAENSFGFWSLMSSGGNIGDGGPNGIGDAPTDLSAWELFQLGWLDAQGDKGPFYEVVKPGEKKKLRLGPNNPATKKAAQAIIQTLPDKVITTDIGNPASGEQFFWSGSGDNFNRSLTKTGISGTALTAKVRYDIEAGWDYAFVEASTDGGTTWQPVATNLNYAGADESGFNTSATGISGTSAGFADSTYQDLTATLPAGTNAVRFRYQTDAAVAQQGLMVDDIAIDGTTIGTAEANEDWAADGFSRTDGKEETAYFNAYFAENRQFDGYDKSLATGYNFGFLNTRPDWVEFFRHEPGMLVTYWDTSQSDNNVGEHPGEGLILPVDARPTFYHTAANTLVRPRILAADATFSLDRARAFTIHINGEEIRIPRRPAAPVFNDLNDYWFNADEHGATGAHPGRSQPGWYGVRVPKTGTKIRILDSERRGSVLELLFNGR